jgi:hypothetical protein
MNINKMMFTAATQKSPLLTSSLERPAEGPSPPPRPGPDPGPPLPEPPRQPEDPQPIQEPPVIPPEIPNPIGDPPPDIPMTPGPGRRNPGAEPSRERDFVVSMSIGVRKAKDGNAKMADCRRRGTPCYAGGG